MSCSEAGAANREAGEDVGMTVAWWIRESSKFQSKTANALALKKRHMQVGSENAETKTIEKI